MKLLNNYKFWWKVYTSELIIMLMYGIISVVINIIKGRIPFFPVISNLILLGVLIVIVKTPDVTGRVQNLFSCLSVVAVSFIMSTEWLNTVGNLVNLFKNIKWLDTVLCLLGIIIYLVMYLPIIFANLKNITHSWLRLMVCIILEIIIYSGAGTWNVVGHPYLATFIKSGAMAAIAFFLTACCIGYCWGYRLNPNLKFKKISTFSWLILLALIVYATISVIWNDFGGDTHNFISLMTTYDFSGPFHYTFQAFCEAFEAGVLEESGRYLYIIIFLAWLSYTKFQVPGTILLSALVFSGMHIVNGSIQSPSATLAQMLVAFGSGLVYSVLYLYSGKLWLPMLAHFFYDYCLAIQSIEIQSGNWNFSIAENIVIIIQVGMPIILTIWMLTGKRIKVLQTNAKRLVA